MEKITWYGSGVKPQAANGSDGVGENALSFRIGSVRSGNWQGAFAERGVGAGARHL